MSFWMHCRTLPLCGRFLRRIESGFNDLDFSHGLVHQLLPGKLFLIAFKNRNAATDHRSIRHKYGTAIRLRFDAGLVGFDPFCPGFGRKDRDATHPGTEDNPRSQGLRDTRSLLYGLHDMSRSLRVRRYLFRRRKGDLGGQRGHLQGMWQLFRELSVRCPANETFYKYTIDEGSSRGGQAELIVPPTFRL